MLQVPEREEAAREQPQRPPARPTWLRTLHATSTRRALVLTALGGLLIAGVITALPFGDDSLLTGYTGTEALAGAGSRANAAFDKAKAGDCLNWLDNNPDSATIVDCKDDHRFEVAESVDMRTYPGAEYGPDAAPPSAARIQQISLEQCQPAVKQYLGAKYDPNSKFTISMLWSGDRAWKQSGERRMLCGLQLPGPNNQQLAFKGKVADIDQSKVWPAGTCLGIDPSTNQPTDTPADCSAPHAMEVTGSVNLSEKFPGALPSEPDQDGFIKDACTKMTDAYLAPSQLRSTTLTLIYSTISLPSWSAGSHQVACSIGATLGNGGWATLINSAKGPLLINGRPPVPPPDIPEERLNLPPIPLTQEPATTYSPPASDTTQYQSPQQATPHLPQQSTAPTATESQAPTDTPTPQGNTFLGEPPPPPPPPAPDAPPMDAVPPDAAVPPAAVPPDAPVGAPPGPVAPDTPPA